MINKKQIDKFYYMNRSVIKDILHREENIQFEPLRNSINCINGLSCGNPTYQPYPKKESQAVCFIINVIDESVMGTAFRILTRSLDKRYGGVPEWVCKLQHTDTGNNYIIWLDSGSNTRNKELSEITNESNIIKDNIMFILDKQSILEFFERDKNKENIDHGHINTEDFEKIKIIHERSKKIEGIIND